MTQASIGVDPNHSLLPAPIARALAFAAALALASSMLLASGLARAQDWTYRVRPGDTVWDLSRKYIRDDVPWQRVQAYNRIQSPAQVTPGTQMRFPVAWLKRQPAKVVVVGVHGDAFALDAKGRRSPVVQGMRLGIGSTLHTAADASLTLQFADGSRLLLQGGSELMLDKLSAYGATGMTDTRLRLPKGRTSSEIRPLRGNGAHFIIETPDIMSSVRGTSFRVASDGGKSRIEVTEGRVQAAGAGAHVLLRDQHGTVNGADGTPAGSKPLLPAPASLALDATQRPILLRWAAVPEAQAYRVQVGANAAFPYLLHDRVVSGIEDAVADLPDGNHSIRVRAIDALGLEGGDVTVEAQVAFAPPLAIAPAEGSKVDVDRPRFHWTDLGPGMRYHFQLAGAAGFEQPLVDLQALDRTEVRGPQALPPGEYAWRIAAVADNGRRSAYNEAARFTVLPPGAGPALEGASAASDPRILQLRWPEGSPGQTYRVQLSRKADFSSLELDRAQAENHIAIPGLASGTWYARTQLIDGDGYARPFGPSQSFKVGCQTCRWAAVGGVLLLLLSL